MLSGQVELNFESPPNTLQHIRVGKLKALGITSAKRSPLVPEIPTIAEQGLPGYEMVHWFGMFGPAGLPKDIMQKLNTEIIAIIASREVADQINAQGGTVIGDGPEQFSAYVAKDTVRWRNMIREAKIKVE
jgi:tripartite-type tricarboxylate transporter receptor subunit TctC